tara:strand:- start:239 stop:1147 length:909 start_codon:yes stop_codon:yes gene_type:complete
MKFVVGFLLAFLSIFIGSPLIALLMGSLLVIVFKFPNNYIEKSVATNLLQAGIILIGFTISASTALEITFKYFPYVSIFVLIIFFVGLLLANLFKIEKKLGILLASGTAICGATAMAAISPLIKSKPKDLFVALAIIFIFNAFSIGILPLVGIKLGMSSESFGAWSSMAVHDTSSVIGTAIAFGGSALETATTLKLSRTIWLIPLIIILGTFYPNKSRAKFPIFISLFITAIAIGSFLNFSQETINLIDITSRIFLISALFCIGTQISFETIKEINTKTFIYALSLWLVALIFSFLIINLFT